MNHHEYKTKISISTHPIFNGFSVKKKSLTASSLNGNHTHHFHSEKHDIVQWLNIDIDRSWYCVCI